LCPATAPSLSKGIAGVRLFIPRDGQKVGGASFVVVR
jgi:hypothetical protein